jgi:hypothetical protein
MKKTRDSHLFIITFFSYWPFYISSVCRQATDEPFGQESFQACSKNYHYLKVCLYAYLTLTVQAANPKALLQVPSAIVRLISYRTSTKDSTHPTGHGNSKDLPAVRLVGLFQYRISVRLTSGYTG